jgi:hypothetical protein
MLGKISERLVTMSITYSIDHLLTSVEDVSVEVADKASFALVRTLQDEKTGEVSSVYSLPSGDPTYPATVTYRSALNSRAAGNLRRISCTLNTWARSVDSVSGEEVILPISGTISLNVPQGVQVEVADLDDMIGNLFSFMYVSVTTKVRSTTWLAKLLFGITQVV